MSEPIVKVCVCGADYTQAQWDALPYLGRFDVEEDGDQRAELRNCSKCSSSIALDVGKPRTDA